MNLTQLTWLVGSLAWQGHAMCVMRATSWGDMLLAHATPEVWTEDKPVYRHFISMCILFC